MIKEDLPREVHDQEYTTREHSFDELTEGQATNSVSRRRVLRLLGMALLIAALLLSTTQAAWAQINQGNQNAGKNATQTVKQDGDSRGKLAKLQR